MDHPSSKSPGPADSDFEVATGEDSQESTTLKNALQPLPDTQSTSLDYQQISPENHVTKTAPFISRPIQLDASDLSIGFAFDKPLAVMPGRFSGRKHLKPVPPVLGSVTAESDAELSKQPSFEQSAISRGSVAVRANPDMSIRLPSPQDKRVIQELLNTQSHQTFAIPVQGHQASHHRQNCQRPQIVHDVPTPVPLPRKKPPFEDYQPAYRAASHQGQITTPVASLKTPAVDKSSNQCHTVKPGPVNISQLKTRTSFQNDISVSSNQPPKSMPGSSPRASMVNRPMADNHQRMSRLNTPTTRPPSSGSRSRNSIVKSNSKAKRSSHPAQVSSSSRSSSRSSTRRRQETPSMKQRSKWTPAELLQGRFHEKLASTAADLAVCFNDKFADIGAEVDQHLQTISDLKKGMSKQHHDLSRYKECILGKDDKIQQLEEHCDQLLAKVNITREELDARSTKVSKLEEKCRSYKEFLNNAIAEQQELYKATKAKCEGTITMLHAEDTKRKALQETERKHAELTREKLNELVRSTVSEYKQKERECNIQVEALSQKIQEREADVLREREIAQSLLQQNGSINNIQGTLGKFEAQIEEVVGKVIEAVAQQYQPDDQSTKDMNVKLDQIMQYLQIVDARTSPTAELSREMHELNEKTVVSISEKLEPLIAAQIRTKTSIDALYSGVEACMNDVWEELNERQSILEDCYMKQEADRQERVIYLQQEVKKLERDLAQQNKLYLRSEQALRGRDSTINKLEFDIASLTQAKEQHLTESKRLDQLRQEYSTLKDDSASKASLVSELQNKLQESAKKLITEQQKHEGHSNELQRLMEQRVAEARVAHVQAVESAQQDAMLRMNEIKADTDARLAHAVEQRTALQNELNESKQKMKTIQAESSKTSEKVMTLQEELQSSRAAVAQVREQGSQKDAAQQVAKEQQLKVVQELQAKLTSADVRFNRLADNTKLYDKAAQTVLLSMKQWTQNYATIQSMTGDLRKDKYKNGILAHIDSNLKPLVELQLLQTAVSQYCQTQKEAYQMLSGSSTTAKTASQVFPTIGSLNMAASSVLDRMRRVTVMSPASNASSPQPPSVQFEQERRRIGQQPKSILKLMPQAREGSDEEARQELLSNTSMNRGPYNRPVSGRKSRIGLPAARLSQKAILGGESIPVQKAGTVISADDSRKHKLDLEKQPDRSLKRTKSTYFSPGYSSPPKHAGDRPDTVPAAPHKAGLRSTVADKQPSSSALLQPFRVQSQSQASAPGSYIRADKWVNTHRASFKSSRDPLGLSYGRVGDSRGKEESQESMTHSQDLSKDDDRGFPISSPNS